MGAADHHDIVIVGAGLSGINAAYRVQTEMPGCNYTILEAQKVMGGTWALFRYPGIRSDSDLFTFGFAWKPWSGLTRFANGPEIAQYMEESAAEFGIDKKIQYQHKVTTLSWNSSKALWTISVEANGSKRDITTKFIILGTGYYDYHTPLETEVAGIKNFKGQVLHPQFWPEDLDYKNKKVVIIGSGATAVTLLPNMAREAAQVTMLQRSPSYVMALPNANKKLPKWVPSWIRFGVDYLRYLILPFLFFKFCRTFPRAARALIKKATTKELADSLTHDPHFNPAYNPWEQRLCMSPDGDFFESIRKGKASVVTGKIKTMTANSIVLESGQELPADIVVTATGLKLQIAGGAKLLIDGQTIATGDKFIWQGLMLEDVPNCAFVIGYTNASWTLGADCTALAVCRIIKDMKVKHVDYAVPSTKQYKNLKEANVLNLSSTYITKSVGQLPKAGDTGPWKARSNYFVDYYTAKFGNLNAGLRYVSA